MNVDRGRRGNVAGDDEWFLASAPDASVEVPESVRAVAEGRKVRCVWRNSLGGLTFEIPDAGQHLKWAPPGSDLPLLGETARLRWVQPFTVVPTVLDAGTGEDGSTWLLTTTVPGTTAVADRWKASPRVAVRAIGEGLRTFHDTVPVQACPFDWSADRRLAHAVRAATAGDLHPDSWHPSHRHLSVGEALALLTDPPAIDQVVVCHGDACAPNTLIGDDGRCSAHVDLGSMGTADRWSDLAVATWSTEWNYGPGWEDEFLDAYGIAADPERTRYYRLLWDLAD